MRRVLALCLSVIPFGAQAQNTDCKTYKNVEICDCYGLAPNVKVCGSWDEDWMILPPQLPVLAMLTSESGGITTITQSTFPDAPLADLKALFLENAPNFVDATVLPAPKVASFDTVSFAVTSVANPNRRSPVAVTLMRGTSGNFVVKTVFVNAFNQTAQETLTADMQAQHNSLFDQIKVDAP